MAKSMDCDKKTLPEGRKSLPGASKGFWPKTEEEAWAMSMEEVMAIPLETLMEGYEPVTEEEREAAFAALGKPSGVGLRSGFVDAGGEGLPGVNVMQGDQVTANEINFRGLRRLRVVRLGKSPDPKWYAVQIENRNGEVVGWDANRKENVFWIELLFKAKGSMMYGPMEQI